MKKVLIGIFTTGALATNLMALQGTIDQLKFDGTNDTIKFTLKKAVDGTSTGFYPLVATSVEMKKSLIASVLTAKSTSATVDAYIRTVNGVKGWSIIIIK